MARSILPLSHSEFTDPLIPDAFICMCRQAPDWEELLQLPSWKWPFPGILSGC